MKKNQFILQMGSEYLTLLGKEVFYREPNLAIVSRRPNLNLLHFGEDVLSSSIELSVGEEKIKPISSEVVHNLDVMSLIIKEQIVPIVKKSLFSQPEIYVLIPSGLTLLERDNIELTLNRAGLNDVTLSESLMCMLPFMEDVPGAVVILDEENTEIGVIDEDGIIMGCSVDIDGRLMSNKIRELILERNNVSILDHFAKLLKDELASLYENDTSGMEVIGKDILENRLKGIEVTAEFIRPAVHFCFKKIVELIESVLATLGPNNIEKISKNGIYVCGPLAKIVGLSDFLIKYLKIPVWLLDNPTYAVFEGFKQILADKKFENTLNKIRKI